MFPIFEIPKVFDPAPPPAASIFMIDPAEAASVILLPADSMIVEPDAVEAFDVLPCK